MIVSFALAFLIAATLGMHVTVAALAVGSVMALALATTLTGPAAGLAAVLGLQVGYLAGHAALLLQQRVPGGAGTAHADKAGFGPSSRDAK